MLTLAEFSRLTAGIYAAATSPHRWESAIRDIADTLGGNGGALLTTASAPIWSIDDTTLPDAARRSYTEHFARLDRPLADLRGGPVGAVRTGAELLVPHRHSEFYADWLHPNDIEDGLFVRLGDGAVCACFVVHTGSRDGTFATAERVEVFAELIGHLQQALRVAHDLRSTDRHDAMLSSTLDTIRHAMVIVGAAGRVIETNAAAECVLSHGDGLTLRDGRLEAADRRTQRELEYALHAALAGRAGSRSGHSFTCPRPSGRRAFVIHVVPLQPGDDHPTRAAALLVVVDTTGDALPAGALWGHLYGFTRSETQVAERIVRGSTIKEIADELSVSLQTVRTHLQHIFDKTGTHRQAELMRLLLRSSP
ncbi:LuxR family transcriptional regulator [Mycobacterium sp. PS03-16]|uniref:helix-turn-helix transcriptional regulator n=1 Tax=Mycobacterium sp. PS03-16 TaxID=2559611 RepID=UPI0010733DC0|nr:helix-turn-helix transcriptional regulator [Mycobacterium sp. PS03-16]TFV54953.1 LuxR family transcriptional regulator [Mycobacterium sp. PS03-16]